MIKFKKENIMVLITGIVCVLIVVLAVNYTYSFFAVEKTNNSVITGEVESMKLSVTVTRVAPTDNSKLIPQQEDVIELAVTGTTKNCVDGNGNTICHVYKVTLKNEGSSSALVSGTLVLDKKENPNLKWAQISGLTNPTLIGNKNLPSVTTFITNDELLAGASKDYYVVVWINETGSSQTDTGDYTGTVTFATGDANTAGASGFTEIDNSGANAPAYVENLIPVMYDTTTNNWVVADTTSSTSTYGWYDYDAKKWANAVLVNDAKRQALDTNYKDANGNYIPGTPIGDSETDGVLAFYVWIPRYKYKVWNINKVPGTDTYNAETTGIDIVFETGTETTGTISCSYSYNEPSSEAGSPNETCTDSGTSGYYTHPAFKFGNDNLTGIWVGKFEISSTDQTSSNYGGGRSTTLTPRVLPNVMSWRNNPLSNFWKVIKDMQAENNIYGLTTATTEADTHLVTNMEWGAVAYLTHSDYGRCEDDVCTEVSINNSGKPNGEDTTYTGRSSGSPSVTSYTATGTYTYDGKDASTGEFVTDRTLGASASTTGNIYGIYDMSGGTLEYVMGNISKAYGSYTYYASSAGSNYTYSGNEKYVTTYAYGTSNLDQKAYNRGRLGDATSESMKSVSSTGGWYSDNAGFPYTSSAWFRRGGSYDSGSGAGVFYFSYTYGTVYSFHSARASLVGFAR